MSVHEISHGMLNSCSWWAAAGLKQAVNYGNDKRAQRDSADRKDTGTDEQRLDKTQPGSRSAFKHTHFGLMCLPLGR